MSTLSKKQKFLKLLFYVIPHHAISRVVYLVTRLRGPQVEPMIAWFVKKYGVDMSDAKESEIGYYQTFNEFFTRPLKQGIRPIAPGDNTLACPCDGKVSQAGPVRSGSIMQAKGRAYSALELLGGDKTMAAEFADGRFATIYLAPHDYHRMHMPLDANLVRMIHVPGRLFSVAEWTVEEIPQLFARNERLVTLKPPPDPWRWCWSARLMYPQSKPCGVDRWCRRAQKKSASSTTAIRAKLSRKAMKWAVSTWVRR